MKPNNNTTMQGIKKAPPPFSQAVKGNLQTFPRPTDIEIQDIRNSIGLSHCCRSGSSPASSFFPASLIKLFNRNKGTFVLNISSSFSSMSPTLLGFLTILLPLRLTMLLLLKQILVFNLDMQITNVHYLESKRIFKCRFVSQQK